jgi:hypothetical protein
MRVSGETKRRYGEIAEINFFNSFTEEEKENLKYIDNYWDYEYKGTPVEVKSAQLCVLRFPSKGRKNARMRCNHSGFTVSKSHHEELREKSGWYSLSLMIKEKVIHSIMIKAGDAETYIRYWNKKTSRQRISLKIFYSKNAVSIQDFKIIHGEPNA